MGLSLWSTTDASAAITPPEAVAEPIKEVQPLTAAPKGSRTVKITGYNAVPEQTDSDPFTTAWGVYSNPEVVIAASRDLLGELPFGTVVTLEAENPTGPYCGYDLVKHFIGYRVVADTMNARHTGRMDILFAEDARVDVRVNGGVKTVNAAKALASCGGITVRVVGKVSTKDITPNTTQAELALRVEQTLAMK